MGLPESGPDLYARALTLADEGERGLGDVLVLLEEAAARGDSRAKYAVANWHLNGMDGVVEKDPRAALILLRELERSFIAEALFDLAWFYDLGKFVRKNEHRAFSLYMRAALLGHSESCRQISEFYREGVLVGHDAKLAKAWATRAEQAEADISPPYRIWLRSPVSS